MKYLKLKAIALALSLTLLASCGGGSGKNNNDNRQNSNVSISITTTSVKALYGKSTIIPVSTNNTDITVDAPAGSGCARQDRTAVACTPTAAGSYPVKVMAVADTSKFVNVTVTVPEAEIDTTGLSTDSDGKPELKLSADETESDPITLYAAGEWTAEVDEGEDGDIPDWISLKDASDIGSSSIVVIMAEENAVSQISGSAGIVKIAVTLEPNYSGQERRAAVIIKIGSATLEITVTQSPTVKGGNANLGDEVSVNISPSTAEVMTDEPKTFTVTAVKTDDFTLSVIPASGGGCVKSGGNVACTPTVVGTYEITVTATANTSKQNKATLEVLGFTGESQLAFYADDTQSGEIAFNAPGDWTATVKDSGGAVPSWISLDAASGTVANNTISFTLELNYSGAARTAYITVSVNGKDMELTVVQQPTTSEGTNLGDEVSINISPSSESAMLGEAKTFTVTAVKTDFTFSVTPASGHGCVKSGSAVVCTPTVADTYKITVTATENTSKTRTADLIAKEVKIGISPDDAEDVELFSDVTFTVTTENTDFTFAVSPSSGHGCERPVASSEIVCAPTVADTYAITVTADEDGTKTATATFTSVIPTDHDFDGIDMVYVGTGTFKMGCDPENSPGASTCTGVSNFTMFLHTVTLTNDFYIGKYEVTQSQWNAVMEIEPEDNPSVAKGDNLPVTNVTHDDIMDFIDKLIERDEGKGWIWRLPTEAEWEYAARGGPVEPKFCEGGCWFSGSNDSTEVAWAYCTSGYGAVSGDCIIAWADPGVIQPVGGLKSNELGLYDMSGNVREWCADGMRTYEAGEIITNPVGDAFYEPIPGSCDMYGMCYYGYATRGGSFQNLDNILYVWARNRVAPDATATNTGTLGFRLALTLTGGE